MKRSVLMFISDKRGSLFSVKVPLIKESYTTEEIEEIIAKGLEQKKVEMTNVINLAFNPTPCENPDVPEKSVVWDKELMPELVELLKKKIFNTEDMVHISVEICRSKKRPVKN